MVNLLPLLPTSLTLQKKKPSYCTKKRWEIELFFKWIKQNLRIKKFIGYNEHAIKIQIFSALITYMLIYLKCKIYRQNVKYEMLKITRILRLNLLEIWDDRLQAQLCVT
ncbi:MAG: transposase [Zhenhengia sp.]|uniref:transposase n=1 Tax=Zhenhengia sp. TaxID=2944208 RepID=UPI0039968A27